MPSSVLEELRRPRPSQTPEARRSRERKRKRYGVKAWRKLAARVTALEAENVALKQHLAIEVAPSLEPGVASPMPERPEQLLPPHEMPITDSRRPSEEELEAKALAAEERHKLMALAYRRQTLLWTLMRDRGFGRMWSSPYWQQSGAYRTGF
jgi:hypothetical protein